MDIAGGPPGRATAGAVVVLLTALLMPGWTAADAHGRAVDYVDGEPDAGIINQPDRFPALSASMIASLNENGGEKNITAGFHVVEFLLWART
jgi:putative iron-regulated protein